MVQAFIPSGSMQVLITLGANSFVGDQDLGDNEASNLSAPITVNNLFLGS